MSVKSRSSFCAIGFFFFTVASRKENHYIVFIYVSIKETENGELALCCATSV